MQVPYLHLSVIFDIFNLLADMMKLMPFIYALLAPAICSHTEERKDFHPHREHKGMSFSDFQEELKLICPSVVLLGEVGIERNTEYDTTGNTTVASPTVLDHMRVMEWLCLL